MKDVLLLFLVLAVLMGFADAAAGQELITLSEAKGRNGMVVSVSSPATEAGVNVLRAGGNAVDAAIAVEFALAVSWPEAGNIGGGGFMMVHPPDGQEVVCIDYRETAPQAATETMFGWDDGRHTHKIVGVPGTVHGMALAHERYGKLPWKRVVLPAARLAAEGVVVDQALATSLNNVLQQRSVRQNQVHQELVRVYAKPNGRAWTVGDRLVLPDLGATLRRIADQGADGFYGGETAALLVGEMQRHGGLISNHDLTNYRAKVRPAIHGTYKNHDIFGPPPPSSGGTCLVAMLNILEQFKLDRDRFSARNLHLFAEAMKRAYRDRALYLADPDFAQIPNRLTRKTYAQRLAETINAVRATPSQVLTPPIELANEPPQTTHFSVADGDGMAVSNTTTLEGSWGARIVVEGAGFVLNNEMGDFNWFPGHTDRNGRIGTEPNRIRPGQRMLSSQTPTIVAREGRPVLVTGSPGGRTIINTTLQMVLNIVEFEMRLPEAMKAARIHHQGFPDRIMYETFDGRITPNTLERLTSMGHSLYALPPGRYQGDAHSILIDWETGTYHGVADWRRSGAAAGY